MFLAEFLSSLENLFRRLRSEFNALSSGDLSKFVRSVRARECLVHAENTLRQMNLLLQDVWNGHPPDDFGVKLVRYAADALESMAKALRASSEEFGKEDLEGEPSSPVVVHCKLP